jgi:hypothetical protein
MIEARRGSDRQSQEVNNVTETQQCHRKRSTTYDNV